MYAIIIIVVLIISMLFFYTINNKNPDKATMNMRFWIKSALISGGFELDSTSKEGFELDSSSEEISTTSPPNDSD